MAFLNDREFTELACAAISAPSADNLQPWMLRRHGDGVAIALRPTRKAMFFDYEGWADQLSLGAAIENMLQIAPGLGIRLDVAASGSRWHVLVRGSQRTAIAPSRYENAVGNRGTNRGRYAKRAVTEETKEILRDSI